MLPITVVIAARNEAVNITRCVASLTDMQRIIVVDSASTDDTCQIARDGGAEVVQFEYAGGYPKKRQWALENLAIDTPWVLLLDADEVIPAALAHEIAAAVDDEHAHTAYLIRKGFHFLGRKFRFGGFSHSAVLLFKTGKARFEHLVDDVDDGLDMEVHERLIVDGSVGSLSTPLAHNDFKGLEAYIERHDKYSAWEARVRYRYLETPSKVLDAVSPRLFGNLQERRRFLKQVAMRMPCEHHLWFLYHYVLRLGFLEGRRGWIASRIRSNYIYQTNAKLRELRRASSAVPSPCESP